MPTKHALQDIQKLLLPIEDHNVLLDRDVAQLYGVSTKRINEAVKNNPKKFPKDYAFYISKKKKLELVENFDRLRNLKHSGHLPRAFTEKGLYMNAHLCGGHAGA